MINSLYYMQSLKWVVPATFLLGSSPNFMNIWACWRILTLLFPTRVYQQGDDFIYSLYQKLVVFFYENYTGVKIVLSGDTDCLTGKKENVILMCNHQSTVDWIVADILAQRQGCIGRVRYILKDGLRYFPLYGFYFRQHSCVYVKRSGKFQEKKALKHLSMIKNDKTNFWMVVYPEGTRYNPENPAVVAKSRQFAENQGMVPLDYLLTPRIKAMQMCINVLRENTDAIYDVTIGYSCSIDKNGQRKSASALAEFLNGECRELHLNLERVPMSEVPSSEEDIQLWLYQQFQKKDRMMKRFFSQDKHEQGTLVEDGKQNSVGLRYTLPVFLFWVAMNGVMWGTSMCRPSYYRASLFWTIGGVIYMGLRD